MAEAMQRRSVSSEELAAAVAQLHLQSLWQKTIKLFEQLRKDCEVGSRDERMSWLKIERSPHILMNHAKIPTKRLIKPSASSTETILVGPNTPMSMLDP